MIETWIRRTLYFAGAWNVAGGTTALADPAAHFSQMYAGALQMSDHLQAFFFRATWINVIAWGVSYMLAAKHPPVRQTVLIAGGAGKSAYFAACLSLFQSGQGSTLLLAAGLFDVVFAILFFGIVWRTEAAGLWTSRA